MAIARRATRDAQHAGHSLRELMQTCNNLTTSEDLPMCSPVHILPIRDRAQTRHQVLRGSAPVVAWRVRAGSAAARFQTWSGAGGERAEQPRGAGAADATPLARFALIHKAARVLLRARNMACVATARPRHVMRVRAHISIGRFIYH
jgi:hypothetical protein